MIVCKFGGTSVQDAQAMLRLARIVAAREHEQPVVVVSALARVTDGLVSLAESVRQGHGAALEAAVETLHDRHRAVAHELEGGEAALPALDAAFAELRRVLRPAVGRVLAPAERDFLLGQGELWSSRLVEAALTGAGIPVTWVDARQVIITDDRHGRASV